MSLNLKSVSLKLDNRQILKDVSLEINEGEIVSVIGPNGAGKSTLLNVLTGDITLTLATLSMIIGSLIKSVFKKEHLQEV